MAATPQSWSDLPADLAGLVLRRLCVHADRVRFAAVCPQWRSAARQVRTRLPPPPPLLTLKAGGTFYSMPRGEPLRFAGCDEHFATASGSWLVYRRVYCLVLVDPFSGATMTLPDPSNAYGSEDEGDDFGNEGDDCEDGYDSSSESHLKWMDTHNFQVMKLIVCSPDLIAALFWSSQSYRVAVCRPGGSSWSVAWNLSLWITDITFYKGKLFAVDYGEDLLALDIRVDDKTGNPQVCQIRRAIKINHFDNPQTFHRMLYLVESRGKLLLVRRMIFHEHAYGRGQIHTFDGQYEPELVIFKADFRRSRWAKVTNLEDDEALFLGPCSRAVCLPHHESPGNRVWFLDDYKDYYPSWKWSGDSSSDTCDMANRKFSSPLPMISWSGRGGPADNVGAVWLFPSN
ncbi:unnamed protein product [Urochloa decumbens]|uniref:DUF295 domain-containing protein n=1 Tax=Urochloa decumbens TaxID=240449 RepID=A0ABC9AJS1_9POAL